ncbi:MAG TPA: energy-coupling factor transporter ATPase [Verrucomicrobiae bacterium]|nr:energy-coupling factor transporter ATPase [Verrucomicrobiae bacterium]
MIKLENVTFRYGEENEPVINGLSLEINPGEVLAVLGPNGSGKSTLARLLNGAFLPSGGRVLVDNIDTSGKDTLWEVRRRVGVVLQNPDNQLLAPSVAEDVAFGPENLGLQPRDIEVRVEQALQRVGMEQYASRQPSELSGGQKQRVAIAGILAMNPNYMVLDESSAMLDSQNRREVMHLLLDLKGAGVGIVLITHLVQEAIHADKIAIISEGRLVRIGSPREILSRHEILTEFGLEGTVAARVAAGLSRRGMLIPRDVLTVEELVEALC